MRQRRSGCCAVEPSLSSTRSHRCPTPPMAEGLTLERAPPPPRNTDNSRNLGWYLNGWDHSGVRNTDKSRNLGWYLNGWDHSGVGGTSGGSVGAVRPADPLGIHKFLASLWAGQASRQVKAVA